MLVLSIAAIVNGGSLGLGAQDIEFLVFVALGSNCINSTSINITTKGLGAFTVWTCHKIQDE